MYITLTMGDVFLFCSQFLMEMHAVDVGHFDLKPGHIFLQEEPNEQQWMEASGNPSVTHILMGADCTSDIVVIDYDRSAITLPYEYVRKNTGTVG